MNLFDMLEHDPAPEDRGSRIHPPTPAHETAVGDWFAWDGDQWQIRELSRVTVWIRRRGTPLDAQRAIFRADFEKKATRLLEERPRGV